MLERREIMMKKKNDQQQITNPPKTAEQTHFENQWKAGSSSTNEANKPDKSMNHKKSNPSRMEPSSSRNDSNFHVDNYKNYEPFREEQIPSGHLDYNEDANVSSTSNWTSKTSGIPGLDLVPPEKPPVEKEIDERLDDDVTAVVNLIEDEVTMMTEENEAQSSGHQEKTNVENISAAGLSNILNNPKILELLAASLGATTSKEDKSNKGTQNQDQQQNFPRNDQQHQFDRNDLQQQQLYRKDQQFDRKDQQQQQFDRNDLQQQQFDRNDLQQQQFSRNDLQQQQLNRNDLPFTRNDLQRQQLYRKDGQQQQFGRNDQQHQQFGRNELQQQQLNRNDPQFPRNDQQQSQFGMNDQQQRFGRPDPQQFGRNDQSFNPNRELDNNQQQQQNFNSNRSDYFSDNQPIKVSPDFNDNRQQQQRPGIQSLLDMPINESNKFNQNQRNLPMDPNNFNQNPNNFNQNPNHFNQNPNNFNQNQGNFNNNPGIQRQNPNNMGHPSNNNQFNNQPNQFNNQTNQFNNQQRNNFNPNNFNNPGMQHPQQNQFQQNPQHQHPQQQQQHPQQQQQQNQFQPNMINNENQPAQRSLEETPTFKPAKIIDYDHRPKPSFEETLLEFRVFKTIEYNHRSYEPTPSNHRRINPVALFSESKEEEPNKLYALNKYNEVIAKREKEYKAVKMNTDDISSEEEPFDGFSDDDFDEIIPPKKMKMNPTVEETPTVVVDNESRRKEHLSKRISIDDLLLYPGRKSRPKRIVIILRGASGSGKSYLAKLIRDKEIEMKGSSPRTLSIDNYFIINEQETYEYDPDNENTYMENIKKSFKKTISEGFYDFVIVDCNNIDLTNYNFFYASAKQQEFACYTIEMEMDPKICFERNIHDRTFKDIEETIQRFMPTPYEHQLVDPKSLFPVKEVFIETEEISSDEDCVMEVLPSQKSNFGPINKEKSKWDDDGFGSDLARLDGITNKVKQPTTMEHYLQMDDYESEPPLQSGKKR
ncbi:unnamed protein product, partial [Diamesa tonsa]